MVYEAWNSIQIKENITLFEYFKKEISQSIIENGKYDFSEILAEGIADCKANNQNANELSIIIKELLYNKLRNN